MRVLFFAHLRDVAGCRELELAGDNLGVEALWQKLVTRHPALDRYRSSVRLAKNSEYVGPEALFNEEDEVALIPPVSGG
jgi:molybdopterin converting factor subunit 1